MVASETLRRLTRLLAEELPPAISLRHELHADPEVSHEENRTRKRLVSELGGGELIAGKSLLVTGNQDAGPKVFLRAEMDALPIQEETAVAWASSGGFMHACGHDVHMTGLVAATRALRRFDEPLPVAP